MFIFTDVIARETRRANKDETTRMAAVQKENIKPACKSRKIRSESEDGFGQKHVLARLEASLEIGERNLK